MTRNLIMRSALVLPITLAMFIRVAPMQAASTITVNTTSDVVNSSDGLCSLREAVIAANTNTASGAPPGECSAGSTTDTIEFSPSLPVPSTFVLSSVGAGEDAALTGDLDIVGTLTINGGGAAATILDGNATDRVLEVLPGARVTISGVTIRHGNPGTGVDGGGIVVDETGRLTLNSSTVESNQGGGVRNNGGLLLFTDATILNSTGDFGVYNQGGATLSFTGGTVSGNQGGIYNTASTAILSSLSVVNNTGGSGVHNSGTTATSLTLSNSSILSNSATSGGGILNEGLGAVANIDHVRISLNSATAGGGGINNTGSLTLNASTVDGNQALSGGGIDHGGSSLTLINDTLSGNTATDNSGGLHNRSSATLSNVTLSGNQSGTGANIFNDGDTASLTIRNSIVASPQAGANCVNNIGVMISKGYNLESADTCNFGSGGDHTSTDPMLRPLQDNGGATFTHALLPGSPAIGAGNPAQPGSGGDACPAADQRGVSRPQGTTCDIGSYEFIIGGEADLSLVKVDAVDPVTVGDPITYTVTASNLGPDAAQNVVLSDVLPAGVSYGSATPGQGGCGQSVGVVTCNLGGIANGGSVSVVIVVTSAADGTLHNNATVSSDTADLNPTNNSASETTTVSPIVMPQADLALAKVDAVDPVTVGDIITYTVTASNLGPDAAHAVVLTDTLPARVTYGSATSDQGNCNGAGGVVTCNLGTIPAAGSVSVVILVTTTADGTLTNNATVSSNTADPSLANNSASETTTVNAVPVPTADLSIAMLDGPDPVQVGAALTYTLLITNAGPDAATTVTVTSQLPAGVTYSGASGSGWTCDHLGGLVTCTTPGLGVGPAPGITLLGVAPVSGGTITNTAAVAGREFDPVVGDNTAVALTWVNFANHYVYLPLVAR